MKQVWLALLAASLFAGVPKGMAPLDHQYLKGATFHSPDGWFSIAGPTGWEWFEMRAFDGEADPRWPDAVNQTVAWMIQDPKTFDNFVVVEQYTPGGDVIDRSYMSHLEPGFRRALDPGESIAEFVVQPTPVPVEQSAHFSYKIVRKNKPPTYRYGYLTGMEHKVTLTTSTDSPGEPAWFTRAAASLRWLHEP